MEIKHQFSADLIGNAAKYISPKNSTKLKKLVENHNEVKKLFSNHQTIDNYQSELINKKLNSKKNSATIIMYGPNGISPKSTKNKKIPMNCFSARNNSNANYTEIMTTSKTPVPMVNLVKNNIEIKLKKIIEKTSSVSKNINIKSALNQLSISARNTLSLEPENALKKSKNSKTIIHTRIPSAAEKMQIKAHLLTPPKERNIRREGILSGAWNQSLKKNSLKKENNKTESTNISDKTNKNIKQQLNAVISKTKEIITKYKMREEKLLGVIKKLNTENKKLKEQLFSKKT